MKKIISIFLLVALCICSQTHAQSRADELMKQAQESLEKKSISGRAIFSCKPTTPFPPTTSTKKPVECGIKCQCPLSSGKLLQRGLRTAARCRANGEQR